MDDFAAQASGRSRYMSMSLVPVSASNHSATPTGTMPSSGITKGDNLAMRAVGRLDGHPLLRELGGDEQLREALDGSC